jgi:hypothetical protein
VRVFDALLLEGSKVLHRVALALLTLCEAQLIKAQDTVEFAAVLRAATRRMHDRDLLMKTATKKIGPLPMASIEQLRDLHGGGKEVGRLKVFFRKLRTGVARRKGNVRALGLLLLMLSAATLRSREPFWYTMQKKAAPWTGKQSAEGYLPARGGSEELEDGARRIASQMTSARSLAENNSAAPESVSPSLNGHTEKLALPQPESCQAGSKNAMFEHNADLEITDGGSYCHAVASTESRHVSGRANAEDNSSQAGRVAGTDVKQRTSTEALEVAPLSPPGSGYGSLGKVYPVDEEKWDAGGGGERQQQMVAVGRRVTDYSLPVSPEPSSGEYTSLNGKELDGGHVAPRVCGGALALGPQSSLSVWQFVTAAETSTALSGRIVDDGVSGDGIWQTALGTFEGSVALCPDPSVTLRAVDCNATSPRKPLVQRSNLHGANGLVRTAGNPMKVNESAKGSPRNRGGGSPMKVGHICSDGLPRRCWH